MCHEAELRRARPPAGSGRHDYPDTISWADDCRLFAGQPTLFVQQPPVGNRCVKAGDPEKPHGEWNTLELLCWNGDSVHIVNGQVVMRLHHAERLDRTAPAPLTAGQISLQAEGAEVFYRDVEVMPLTARPPEFAEP